MAIKYYEKMPVVPLRGLVVMPYTLLSFDAGRDKSVAAIETAAENDGLVFLTAQKDPKLTDITAKQLYEIYQEELSAELEKPTPKLRHSVRSFRKNAAITLN